MYMLTKYKPISNNELMIIFGKNVKKYRERKSITQERLAETLHISTVFISRLENGKYGVQFKNITALANVLEIEPHLLFIPE